MAQSRGGLQTVISLVGFQGSGKSTIARKVAGAFGTGHIEVSDIVKVLTNIEDRAELASTADRTKKDPYWLGKEVLNQLEITSQTQDKNIVVLCGTREAQVHEYLVSEGINLWLFELWASPWTRYQRLKKLGKIRDLEQFLVQDVRERDMGLKEVVKTAPFSVPTSDLTSTEEIAQAIKKRVLDES